MIVYTVGTFDLLHVGHLALLEYCKTLGDTLAVGVASDDVVSSYKPNIPVIPLDQRMEMLRALTCVDIVRPYHELEYVSGCKAVEADIFVIGEDWGAKPHNLAVENYLRSMNKKIVQVSYNPRTSSTRIKRNTVSQIYTDDQGELARSSRSHHRHHLEKRAQKNSKKNTTATMSILTDR